MKIIFAGTPAFAASCLESLLSNHHDVVAVYTQPDRPAGRGRKLQPSDVKRCALQASLPCEQPVSLKEPEALSTLQAYQADIMIVVAYGLLLPPDVLNSFKYGCINVHASMLPRWRGAAPIQRAIAAGDQTTGITIMQMDEGLDTGDMLSSEALAIDPEDTGSSLHDKLAALGAELLVKTLPSIANGTATPIKQDNSLACYAKKLTKQEAEIDWSLPAKTLLNLIRAFNSWPVAFTHINGDRIRVWSAVQSEQTAASADKQIGVVLSADKTGIHVKTGEGVLKLTELQWPGGKRLCTSELLNAKRDLLQPGTILGSHALNV